jgi:HEAT repeat protein
VLGKTTDPATFPALFLVLEDSNAMVRRAAVAGIGDYLSRYPEDMYRQQVLDKLADVLGNRCRRYEDGLLKIEICHTLEYIQSDKSKELLLQLAHDVDFDVRKSAILALGSFRNYLTSLTPILLTFLQDTHWSVREAAVTALGLLGDIGVETELLAMLDDPDLAVRKSLLITLGRIGSVRAIPTLGDYLAHDDLDYAAYQGLKILTAHFKEQVAAHDFGENPKVRLFLRHLLEKE